MPALKTGFGNKEATTLGNYALSADGGLSISNLSNQNDASLAFVRAVELGASLGAAYMGRSVGGVAAGAVDVAPPGGSGGAARAMRRRVRGGEVQHWVWSPPDAAHPGATAAFGKLFVR